jgi:hypothetical protein
MHVLLASLCVVSASIRVTPVCGGCCKRLHTPHCVPAPALGHVVCSSADKRATTCEYSGRYLLRHTSAATTMNAAHAHTAVGNSHSSRVTCGHWPVLYARFSFSNWPNVADVPKDGSAVWLYLLRDILLECIILCMAHVCT